MNAFPPPRPWFPLEEMQSARRVQSRMFPPSGEIAGLECAGLCLPERGVGGDFYDFIPSSPGRIVLVLGDISGKGIPAALMMATLRASLRSHCAVGTGELGRLLESVNRLFLDCTAPEHYASLFVGEFDETTGILRYANCGHVPPVLLRGGLRLERLDATSTLLGLFDGWEGRIARTELARGDLLVVVSDGVVEAAPEGGAEFGEQRLLSAVRAHRELRAGALVRAIADEVRTHCVGSGGDDLTVVAARAR